MGYSEWTVEDIRRLRGGFDDRTLPGQQFTHAAHIAVGATYVCELGCERALEHLRGAIPLYNVSQGGENTDTRGYHETLTRFWVDILGAFFAGPARGTTEEQALAAVAAFGGQSKLWERYYSFDALNSLAARRGWIPPDRDPGPRW